LASSAPLIALSSLLAHSRDQRMAAAAAAAGNGSAYFISKAGRIDNLQRRYVNAPSRTRATTAFFSTVR